MNKPKVYFMDARSESPDTSLINKIITRKIYKESNFESKEIQLITKDILNYFQC